MIPAASQKPRLMEVSAVLSLLRARTASTPITEAKIPIAGTISGKSTAGVGFLWIEVNAE